MNKTFVTIISRWTDNLTYQVEVTRDSIRTKMLDEAFRITNQDNRPVGRRVCSTSVGDLMLLDGEYWLVDTVGFKMLDEAQAIAWQKIDARDAHAGFNYCIENGIINAAGEVLKSNRFVAMSDRAAESIEA